MSILKFRVWDLKENQWIKSLDFLNYIWSRNYRAGTKTEVLLDSDDGEHYKICHFTGLKDRNGKEIYENDILCEKFSTEMAAVGSDANIGYIYFAAGSFMLDGDGSLLVHVFSETPDILEDHLVVGNIFENPELLK